jgi:hypothetical protein
MEGKMEAMRFTVKHSELLASYRWGQTLRAKDTKPSLILSTPTFQPHIERDAGGIEHIIPGGVIALYSPETPFAVRFALEATRMAGYMGRILTTDSKSIRDVAVIE